ncbi:phage tail assembly chaperone G [Aerococcus sp. L_32]|uniref:phage tail assembly chaperone G n=1 Tax=Aerococcus sp. L_32 TaxID=3422316 RepID=UPI003D6A48D0
MAKKMERLAIQLIVIEDELTNDEPKLETIYTSPYLTLRDTREAFELSAELEDPESGLTDAEGIDKLVNFAVDHALKGQITKEEFEERMPFGLEGLQEILAFVAFGKSVGKKLQAKKA